MKTRWFALLLGLGFLVAGILGFVPALVTPPELVTPLGPSSGITVTQGYGRLFGIFPVNVLHDLVHLVFGLWGVVVWRSFTATRIYLRSVAVIYAVLAVMGLFPVAGTLWGLIPIYGADVELHAVIAAAAAAFGFLPVTSTRPGAL
jgi:Domain of unknown function (DUF4383)